MAGKFMNRNAVINTIKSQERMNAQQTREGSNNHVHATICQCSFPDCGAFHTADENRPLPTIDKCDKIIQSHKKNDKT